jgi:predicted nucleotidyltransferase
MLNREISVLLIGGAALLEYGLKDATKDIDIVCNCVEDRETLLKSAKLLGFELTEPEERHKRLRLKGLAIKGGHTLDIYAKKISLDFGLTEDMWNRANKQKTIGKMTVKYASREDIFIMKLIANRKGDIEDCSNLASYNLLDYGTIYKEIYLQYNADPFEIKCKDWITYIDEAIAKLEDDYDINIPIANKITTLADQYRLYWEWSLYPTMPKNLDIQVDHITT